MYIDMTEDGVLIVDADTSLERYALKRWCDEYIGCDGLMVRAGGRRKPISYVTDNDDESPFDS